MLFQANCLVIKTLLITVCACFVVLDEDKQPIICLGFIVDGIIVFERGSFETWSSAMFVQRYLKKAGDFPIEKCEVPLLETSTKIANEFFATLK